MRALHGSLALLYIHLEVQSRKDLLDLTITAAQFDATDKARAVALHYLAQNTDWPQYRTALNAARDARANW